MTEHEYRELEPLYEQFKTEIPMMCGKITISRVQRQYRLGYNRAARTLEALAEYGALTYDRRDGTYRGGSTVSAQHEG